MAAKFIFVLCAQAIFFQVALCQCAGPPNFGAGLSSYDLSITPSLGGPACSGNGLASAANAASILPAPGCSGLGNGLGYGNAGLGYGSGNGYGSGLGIQVIPTSGGSLIVSSSSPIAPTGLTITSENVFEGTLIVVGELPFVGAAALEGVVPSSGAGGVSYSLGNGVTAIESISPAAGVVEGGSLGYGQGLEGYGLSAGGIASLSTAAGGCSGGIGLGGYGSAGVAPLALGAGGCNPAGFAPAAEIVAPNGGYGCGYQPGIYY